MATLDFIETEFKKIGQKSRKEYNEILSRKIGRELINGVGEERAKSIIRMLGKVDSDKSKIRIVNHYLFFRKDPSVNYDIGTNAYNTCLSDIDMFMTEVTRLISKAISDGMTDIDLSSIFLYLAQLRVNLKETDEHYKAKIESLVSALAGLTVTPYMANPFYVNIFPPSMTKEILEEFNLFSSAGLYSTINSYLEALCFLKSKHQTKCFTPKIRIIYPIYENVRGNQLEFLRRVFSIPLRQVKTLVEDIEDLGKSSENLINTLEKMKKFSAREEVVTEGVIKRLHQIKENYPLFTQSNTDENELRFIVGSGRVVGANLKPLSWEKLYVDKESYIKTCYRPFLETKIDCYELKSFKEIEPYIDACSQVIMTGIRHAIHLRNFIANLDTYFALINLCNVRVLSPAFLNRLKEKEKELESRFNKPFRISVIYEEKTAKVISGIPRAEYVRIISDIHADINKSRNYIFDFGNDFVINCGDTSGDYFTTRDWIRTYMIEGVSVTGNHLGYTDLGERAKAHTKDGVPFNLQPKNGQQKMLQVFFQNSRTPVLSNDIYEYDDMIILGNTLYTDFKLFGEKNQVACMAEAGAKINDFRYCSYYQVERGKGKKQGKAYKAGSIVPFTPSIHANLFRICSEWLINKLEKFKREENTKPIIIVTHHIPTPYGVMPEFKHDPLSAAFASDLRNLVEEYPQIRLWAYGHTHTPHQYIIGNCRFVCHPFGYYNENNFEPSQYGLRIPISFIKSKKPWTELLKWDIEDGKIKVYER